jgi:hypothetical protein
MANRIQDSTSAASSGAVRARIAIAPAKHFCAHNEHPTQRAGSNSGTRRALSVIA